MDDFTGHDGSRQSLFLKVGHGMGHGMDEQWSSCVDFDSVKDPIDGDVDFVFCQQQTPDTSRIGKST